MHEPQGALPLPHVSFDLNECEDIVQVIKGYIELLQTTPLFPDQETREERTRRIDILRSVAGRLGQQLATRPTTIQLPLNAEEVEEIMNALTGFAHCAQQTVASGLQREYLLTIVEGWRIRLLCSLFSYPSRDALN